MSSGVVTLTMALCQLSHPNMSEPTNILTPCFFIHFGTWTDPSATRAPFSRMSSVNQSGNCPMPKVVQLP